MAEMEEAEFWLPSGFLADDYRAGDDGCSSVEWGDGSDLCSSVGTIAGAESSDEEDSQSLAALSNDLSRCFLAGLVAGKFKESMAAGSPQSTLNDVWSCGNSSGGESSKEPSSLVSSPVSSSVDRHKGDQSWDLLSVAAEAAQGGEGDERRAYDGRGVLGAPATKSSRSSASSTFPKGGGATTGCFINPSLVPPAHHNLRRGKTQQQSRPLGTGGTAAGRQSRPSGSSTAAWAPSPQQQRSGYSGMRAVFLSHRSEREPAGTGVFLPRTDGGAGDLRKKPGCSTVLLPARVVRALNLDLNEITAKSRLPSVYAIAGDAGTGGPATRRPPPQAPPARRGLHGDVTLPPEWTY